MVNYTAIYSTESLKDIEYAFKAVDGNAAKRFCHRKFYSKDIIIRNDDDGSSFPLIDGVLSPTAYVSRCMVSGRYLLYIKYNWDGKAPDFAPVVEVSRELVADNIVTEYGVTEKRKSTHKVGGWYAGFRKCPMCNGYEFLDFCKKYGELNFIEL